MPKTAMTPRHCQRELFSVSDEVSHLDARQIQALAEAFAAWRRSARRPDSVRARERIGLTFLLLRHTGARLGEVLALDDRTALDMQRCVVHLGLKGNTREVPLPEDFCSELHRVLESPMACGLRGHFFHLDAGYLRRICYERGKECGLPRELANPRVLRNSRVVEMLRAGVPLAVVKSVLGQTSLDFASDLQHFTQGDVTAIVRLAQADMRTRSSARNAFIGHVTGLDTDTVMAGVSMESRSGIAIHAAITADSMHTMRLEVGTPIVATVKAPLVNVMRAGQTLCGSARNRLTATVLRVLDSPVIAEIAGRLHDGTEVCALVSSQSARDMALQPGEDVVFCFKSLSVVLNSIR
ncbi:tyrosine-type recombinase/integrase [Pseudodesulfovibrio sp. F-1]|uniref:Tyrosine-type recombinase/integrase n=2 Tax=Pseudodesulfovibrio alkaliphilus TaxID=2661613 RepID=A0A7K1KQY8_9BACT|nr:tyrosine-type recombinase/integrase [Pseudodesulfovibrio alkaliphilus]